MQPPDSNSASAPDAAIPSSALPTPSGTAPVGDPQRELRRADWLALAAIFAAGAVAFNAAYAQEAKVKNNPEPVAVKAAQKSTISVERVSPAIARESARRAWWTAGKSWQSWRPA